MFTIIVFNNKNELCTIYKANKRSAQCMCKMSKIKNFKCYILYTGTLTPYEETSA